MSVNDQTHQLQMQKKSFDCPDDSKSPHATAKLDTVKFEGAGMRRVTCKPGWKWSVCNKPVVGGDSCKVAHFGFVCKGAGTCMQLHLFCVRRAPNRPASPARKASERCIREGTAPISAIHRNYSEVPKSTVNVYKGCRD